MKKDIDYKNLATKTDLNLLKVELREDVSKLGKEIKDHFENSFNHHMGFYMEAMDDKIQLFMDGYADVPNKVLVLRDKAKENDDEHRMFRTRLSNLEQGT